MRLKVYTRTRTNLLVLKHLDGNLPKIGQSLKSQDAIVKVLDVIGPVESPFIVAKPIKGDIKGTVEMQVVKKVRGRVRKKRGRR